MPGAATNESFRYTADNSATASTGTVLLTVSGKANKVVRTIKVSVRKLGFLDYLYLTDYELIDPVLAGSSTSRCPFHVWEYNRHTGGFGPDTSGSSGCGFIYWTADSVLNGPVHTNDGLRVCGSTVFTGNVSTYYNSPVANSTSGATQFGGPGAFLGRSGCTNTPTFNRTGDPATGSFLGMPPANLQLAALATPTGPGCLYTGATTIEFYYVGNTGYMDVTSPRTRATKAECTPGTGKALPSNGVIYVQGVPSSSSDPNYSSCSSNCAGDVSIRNKAGSGGGLKGQLTIGAANNINLIGNMTYSQYPSGNDVLGLIANNYVMVAHNSTHTTSPMRVDAAILALNHSFYVERWNSGSPLGDLVVNGVIAQKFRGPVGTFGSDGNTATGYDKDYNYDTRLKYLTPPHFINPVQSAWVRNSFGEIKPAY